MRATLCLVVLTACGCGGPDVSAVVQRCPNSAGDLQSEIQLDCARYDFAMATALKLLSDVDIHPSPVTIVLRNARYLERGQYPDGRWWITDGIWRYHGPTHWIELAGGGEALLHELVHQARGVPEGPNDHASWPEEAEAAFGRLGPWATP